MKDRRPCAFTLFEIMMALAILSLIFTAVTVSLRGKWEAEHARRGAQRVVLTWMKARSYAWREGREWVVTWNPQQSRLQALPTDTSNSDAGRGLGEVDPEGLENVSSGFQMTLDRSVRLMPELQNDELPSVFFLPNGRVRHTSLLVVGPQGDAWRVRTRWDGVPLMEHVPQARQPSGRANRLPSLSPSQGQP